jgi:hypothetical protein
MLHMPGAEPLRLGSVVLAGSIVRPDCHWSRHLDAGRIAAVLYQCCVKEFVVDFAPSSSRIPGRASASASPFCSKLGCPSFEHGTVYETANLKQVLSSGRLWDTFFKTSEALIMR